jgi:hypothetical protein
LRRSGLSSLSRLGLGFHIASSVEEGRKVNLYVRGKAEKDRLGLVSGYRRAVLSYILSPERVPDVFILFLAPVPVRLPATATAYTPLHNSSDIRGRLFLKFQPKTHCVKDALKIWLKFAKKC